MIQPSGESKPVVSRKKRESKNDELGRRNARADSRNQPDDGADEREENQVNDGRDPKNFFRDMDHRAPARVVDALEHEQAGAFDEASDCGEENRRLGN